MATIISQRKFADLVGVSEATIRKAIAAGYIQKGRVIKESGTPAIDYEEALAEWNSSPAGLQAAEKNLGKPASAYIPKKEQTLKSPVKTGNTGEKFTAPVFDPEAAKSKKEILDTRLSGQKIKIARDQFEFQKQLGRFVDKEKSDAAWFEYGKQFRDNLLTLPPRYTDDIRNAQTSVEGKEIFKNAILEALRGLSQPPDLTKY